MPDPEAGSVSLTVVTAQTFSEHRTQLPRVVTEVPFTFGGSLKDDKFCGPAPPQGVFWGWSGGRRKVPQQPAAPAERLLS